MSEKTHMIHGQPVIAITTGQPFNFLNPDPNTLHLDDIAESLAKDCRYTGKTPGVFYSVAEHSVLCSYAVPDEYSLMALMHDVAEAYTGDWTSPLKKLMDAHTDIHRIIDKIITRAVFKKFGITPYSEDDLLAPCVHEVDGYIYLQERYQLCHERSNDWWDFHGDPDADFPPIKCYEWRMAKYVFIQRFNELFYGTQRRQSTS